jgi:hypothetical protein
MFEYASISSSLFLFLLLRSLFAAQNLPFPLSCEIRTASTHLYFHPRLQRVQVGWRCARACLSRRLSQGPVHFPCPLGFPSSFVPQLAGLLQLLHISWW